MISQPTIFVIGAGAHRPYGFPDGNGLKNSIVEMLLAGPLDNSNEFYDQFLEQYEHDLDIANVRQTMVDFRTRLSNGGHGSIDSFLKHYAKYPGYPEIGKFAVAKSLLPLEFKYDFSQLARRAPDQDWLSYLFSHMLKGADGDADEFLARNSATFVTFNYDRTLEHFFYLRFRNTFGLSRDVALEKSKKIQIVHVYGSLGEFAIETVLNSGKAIDGPLMRISSESIRLMYDDRKGHTGVDDAQTALRQGDRICFLGFSFDPDNISRLRLDTICGHPSKQVWASRFNVPEGDWRRALDNMRPANIDFGNTRREWDALKVLQETRALG